jgi:hypothetical protein
MIDLAKTPSMLQKVCISFGLIKERKAIYREGLATT